jgi:hypothetical protein
MIPVAEFGKAIQIEKNRGEWRERKKNREILLQNP